jgi:hypothetical protein
MVVPKNKAASAASNQNPQPLPFLEGATPGGGGGGLGSLAAGGGSTVLPADGGIGGGLGGATGDGSFGFSSDML